MTFWDPTLKPGQAPWDPAPPKTKTLAVRPLARPLHSERYGLGRMRTSLAEVSNATLSAAVQSYHAFAFDAAYSFIIAINQMLLTGLKSML